VSIKGANKDWRRCSLHGIGPSSVSAPCVMTGARSAIASLLNAPPKPIQSFRRTTVRTLQKVQYYGQRNGAKYLVRHLNNLQRFSSIIMGRLSDTFLKQPKKAHKPHRIAMILSSTTVNQDVSPSVRPACSRWRRCVLLARIAYK
jgi:hypothetical protein